MALLARGIPQSPSTITVPRYWILPANTRRRRGVDQSISPHPDSKTAKTSPSISIIQTPHRQLLCLMRKPYYLILPQNFTAGFKHDWSLPVTYTNVLSTTSLKNNALNKKFNFNQRRDNERKEK